MKLENNFDKMDVIKTLEVIPDVIDVFPQQIIKVGILNTNISIKIIHVLIQVEYKNSSIDLSLGQIVTPTQVLIINYFLLYINIVIDFNC